jgi:polyisoprenoid-binding protein YceI
MCRNAPNTGGNCPGTVHFPVGNPPAPEGSKRPLFHLEIPLNLEKGGVVLQLFLIGLTSTLGFLGGFPPLTAHMHTLQLSSPDLRVLVARPDTNETRWVLDRQESEARYRVREQLAGFDFPNDAVGATSDIVGAIVLGPNGAIVAGQSEFRVQLASLTSDNERRDGYVQGRTLEVEQYPEAVLVPLRLVGLPYPFPESGSASFRLEAELSLHGQTRPTVWEVTADFGSQVIAGSATTAFPFSTFEIPVPRVARVLSVDDQIRLELDFRLVREGD